MEMHTVTLTNNQVQVLTELLDCTGSKEFIEALHGTYAQAAADSAKLATKLKEATTTTFDFTTEELIVLHFSLLMPAQPAVAQLYPHTLRHLATRKVLERKLPYVEPQR